MRGTRKLADRPDVAAATTDHVATTIAAIESTAPARALAQTTKLHPDAPATHEGKGGFKLVKTGDHTVEYRFDSSIQLETTPLPLGSDLRGLMFRLAERHGLPRLEFVIWCEANTALVRAADRSYRLDGGQLSAFDGIVVAYWESLQA